MIYPAYVSDNKLKNCKDLLLITDENKSHYVCVINRSMCNKTKNDNGKYFFRYFLSCFSKEIVLIEHIENCLVINGKQSVKLKSGGWIKFKSHFKQLTGPFRI